MTDFEPLAGAETLASYADRMIHPEIARPLLGLFLLGVVLGEAFLLTRRAYFSLGVHAGFVLGAKTWRVAVSGGIPQWLAGPGSVPLVGAPAAWVLSVIMLALLHLWPGASERCFGAASLSPPSSDYECDSDPISETQPERTDRSGSV